MAELASGHLVEVMKSDELDRKMKDWKTYWTGLVRLTPGLWIFPKSFTKFADKYYEFEFRSSDVVVMTYPKCGTTWTQEIVWTMRNNPDLDNPDDTLPIQVKIPFLEWDIVLNEDFLGKAVNEHPFLEQFNMICKGRNPQDGVFLQVAECTSDPRTIKTHLSFSLFFPSLLDKCKVVYVARNPKDMLVSYYHHYRILKRHDYKGDWETFIQCFLEDNLLYGSYAQHLREAWEKKNHPNLHIIFYEDLKKDVMKELKRLDAFLGTKLTPQQLENVAKHTSFKEMKTREETLMGNTKVSGVFNTETVEKDGGFLRKGETGDWKNKFSPQQEAKVDEWINKNMKDLGVDFKYSI